MNKISVILTIGAPGSGKTTWTNARCKRNNGTTCKVSLDDLRVTLFGDMSKQGFFDNISTYQRTMLMGDVLESQVKALITSTGVKEVIICNVNTRPQTVSYWIEFCKRNNVKLGYKVFDLKYQDLVKINSTRSKEDKVPLSFLKQCTESIGEVVKILKAESSAKVVK